MNRRGLSSIITNVLIILLIVAAGGLIWAFVRPALTNTGESLFTDKYTVDVNIPLESVQVNDLNGQHHVDLIISRKAGEGDLAGVLIILTDDQGNSDTYRGNERNPILELESELISFEYNPNVLTGKIIELKIIGIFMSPEGQVVVSDIPLASTPINPLTGRADGRGRESGSSGPACGNNRCESGENPLTCADCATCGNGNREAGESCDDLINGQACTAPYGGSCTYCSSDCHTLVTVPGGYCGDLVINGPEICERNQCTGQCDFGTFAGGHPCNAACNGYNTQTCSTSCGQTIEIS